MKTLTIYYSRRGENYVSGKIKNLEKGNTEYIVEFLQKNFDTDVFHVETVKEYSKNYMDCTREAQRELDNNERPELKNYLKDISGYDQVIIAGPCWWGTYPMAIFSAIEGLDFSGKKVFPIMTHEGSGMGHSERDLKNTLNAKEFAKGFAIHGTVCPDSEDAVINWGRKNLG
ncbi:MAG: NAD(P)H-dependent oxidoreductase [Erysipelotrichaceae bacterium]|nr:NAD(P)H-dependent oxidoreductase [Erysipelotrichaceae bacterium]